MWHCCARKYRSQLTVTVVLCTWTLCELPYRTIFLKNIETDFFAKGLSPVFCNGSPTTSKILQWLTFHWKHLSTYTPLTVPMLNMHCTIQNSAYTVYSNGSYNILGHCELYYMVAGLLQNFWPEYFAAEVLLLGNTYTVKLFYAVGHKTQYIHVFVSHTY